VTLNAGSIPATSQLQTKYDDNRIININLTIMKSIYDKLKTEVKVDLRSSAKKYDTARMLKYTLMSKSLWSDLTIQQINELITYTSLTSYKMSPYDFIYGENIMTNE
tara:strand:- start:819 stop:1139 length:321 start_codon:yes stop_codon:yes gene_type:complete